MSGHLPHREPFTVCVSTEVEHPYPLRDEREELKKEVSVCKQGAMSGRRTALTVTPLRRRNHLFKQRHSKIEVGLASEVVYDKGDGPNVNSRRLLESIASSNRSSTAATSSPV